MDVPLGPEFAARGPADIATRLKVGWGELAAYVNHDGLLVADGDAVMYEHSETWTFATGEIVVLPFATVHRVRDGRSACGRTTGTTTRSSPRPLRGGWTRSPPPTRAGCSTRPGSSDRSGTLTAWQHGARPSSSVAARWDQRRRGTSPAADGRSRCSSASAPGTRGAPRTAAHATSTSPTSTRRTRPCCGRPPSSGGSSRTKAVSRCWSSWESPTTAPGSPPTWGGSWWPSACGRRC